MIINSCNGYVHNVTSNFENLYSKFVDIPRLKIQLSLLPDVLKTGNNDHAMEIKRLLC